MTSNNTGIKGTKAETLSFLTEMGFPIPKVYYFSVEDWQQNSRNILNHIKEHYHESQYLAIRSSALAEDSMLQSMAGAFDSFLNIDRNNEKAIINAISNVVKSYDDNVKNQVLIQPMIRDSVMSGVIMTKALDDGSPYYVINYDDSSGETDTVTNGLSINKTVYIYNGVKEDDFDSPYLVSAINLVLKLESVYKGIPLDIEFAIDKFEQIQLLQVRPITTSENWQHDVNALVSTRIKYLDDYVGKLMKPRPNLFGNKTLLGLMPDWNPAEMIGVIPHPLSMSLYRELITKSTWRIAREKMGYRKMPNVELMISLFGRTYIDVRNSMNSFIPEGLDATISDKLVNAYIKRLEKNPHLADKIEFDVVPTAYDFKFEDNFQKRYPGLLTRNELLKFKSAIRSLTRQAIKNTPDNSLNIALKNIEKLVRLQSIMDKPELDDPFSLSDYANTLLGECKRYGTLPFAIIARHAFIAETLIRSAIEREVITKDRIALFRRSFKTVAGELSEDFYKVHSGKMSQEDFLNIYGHLRPSSYDILSPRYHDRQDLFEGDPITPVPITTFQLTEKERDDLDILLAEEGFDLISADDLIEYARKAIVGREYAKFIFTKHLSSVLEIIASWGKIHGFNREQMAMLTLDEIKSILFSPLTKKDKKYYIKKIDKALKRYAVGSSFKLSYLIRSKRDLYVVPQQRSSPNFIGNRRIEAPIVLLDPYTNEIPDLQNKIVCIEGADPGYDWIFSRNIAGLVTKYGGANSHMAIRCAEYNLPAAIGCGEQPFERIISAGHCLLDCQRNQLEPINLI
ncbi:MAG: pyruvate, phosphate dikinase [Flavobacteriales bacterium]|nr:pyruvate, phosphate dikinase [Flavobacteriales bacterium]